MTAKPPKIWRYELTKMENTKYNKVQYNNEYIKNNYDSLRITVPKGIKDKLKVYCKENNTTINGLINNYISSLNLK